MRIRNRGKVRDRLWFLGHEESGIYLVESDDGSMIISGGMGFILPEVISQLNEFGIERESINKILILHAHFDHIGVIPFFKRSLPHLEIYASKRAWEILSMPKAIETINAFSRNVTERMGMMQVYDDYDIDWRDDISGVTVSDGDHFNLGSVTMQILETPGHSSCSITAYVPEWKALFPSDGGGIPYQQTIIASGNSNFTKYQESLEKLKPLDVDYYCADHYGYVTGEEARQFITRSIQYAKDHRLIIERMYEKTGDIDRAAKTLVDLFFSENAAYFLSRDIFEGVYRQMVKHIAKSLEDR